MPQAEHSFILQHVVVADSFVNSYFSSSITTKTVYRFVIKEGSALIKQVLNNFSNFTLTLTTTPQKFYLDEILLTAQFRTTDCLHLFSVTYNSHSLYRILKKKVVKIYVVYTTSCATLCITHVNNTD